MAFMRAAQDASHKSHGLYGTISVGCTKKSFLKQLTGKTKEETLLKQTQNFSCTQKHFFSEQAGLGSREECDRQSYEPSLTHRVCVCVCCTWLAAMHKVCPGPHKGFLLYCIRTRRMQGSQKRV